MATALAPLLQRRAWLFPMPGTRGECALLGRYAALQAKAGLGDLGGSDSVTPMNVANHRHEPWARANVSNAASPMPMTPGAGESSLVTTDVGLGVTRALGSLTGLSR
ncbi:hypothetical protein SAMN05216532_0632 [Streptomyces sp. 2231.1]|uniref:hypothetical protein n=1 Tax=Streptomyces sp. 2231.1 TaxID=1855347 RepID=UPI000896A794|nr:hypothetical protein [Streptomyces sp. 2231.1]SEC15515.1 hypothetical protein SAMN05216532_0632 [Streptomyces sp. 2231.1]